MKAYKDWTPEQKQMLVCAGVVCLAFLGPLAEYLHLKHLEKLAKIGKVVFHIGKRAA